MSSVNTTWAVGDSLTSITHPLTQEQVNRYAEVSGDRNPIHIDPEFASTTQFGGTIAHGMLLLARISEVLTSAFGRDWVESGRLKIRFRAPARPENDTYVTGAVVGVEGDKIKCDIQCMSGDSCEIVLDGTAEVTVS